MGDRAVIHFVDGDTVSPATYLHWDGSDVRELLRRTFAIMRERGPDVGYTCARFIGVCHQHGRNAQGSALSLGVWNAPGTPVTSLGLIRDPEYSHGDAGVFIVHLDPQGWSIECHGGYGLDPHAGQLQRPVAGERAVRWNWSELVANTAELESLLSERTHECPSCGSEHCHAGPRGCI